MNHYFFDVCSSCVPIQFIRLHGTLASCWRTPGKVSSGLGVPEGWGESLGLMVMDASAKVLSKSVHLFPGDMKLNYTKNCSKAYFVTKRHMTVPRSLSSHT